MITAKTVTHGLSAKNCHTAVPFPCCEAHVPDPAMIFHIGEGRHSVRGTELAVKTAVAACARAKYSTPAQAATPAHCTNGDKSTAFPVTRPGRCRTLEIMLSAADSPTGGSQDPQNGADQDQDPTYRGQKAHPHEQPDDQQNQANNNHHESIRRNSTS
ncbi:hypothetical protein J3486_15895 [Streptomyces sp. VRA16 Mangrove soil]|nr:hypothetical protein [Streptomyces sp. VRA16 Mangrove soil]